MTLISVLSVIQRHSAQTSSCSHQIQARSPQLYSWPRQAAILHDTIEDTETSPQELEDYFGQQVRLLVQEVTDDKSLPKQERKRLQVEHAPNTSTPGKLIKLGDKICNVSQITPTQPAEWPLQRKREYLDWAEQVISGCRGCNLDLEQHFDAVLKKSRESLV